MKKRDEKEFDIDVALGTVATIMFIMIVGALVAWAVVSFINNSLSLNEVSGMIAK
jgi:Na+-translocating ferredoxin:NAD+ oxidoreductase RnfA subunit